MTYDSRYLDPFDLRTSRNEQHSMQIEYDSKTEFKYFQETAESNQARIVSTVVRRTIMFKHLYKCFTNILYILYETLWNFINAVITDVSIIVVLVKYKIWYDMNFKLYTFVYNWYREIRLHVDYRIFIANIHVTKNSYIDTNNDFKRVICAKDGSIKYRDFPILRTIDHVQILWWSFEVLNTLQLLYISIYDIQIRWKFEQYNHDDRVLLQSEWIISYNANDKYIKMFCYISRYFRESSYMKL